MYKADGKEKGNNSVGHSFSRSRNSVIIVERDTLFGQ